MLDQHKLQTEPYDIYSRLIVKGNLCYAFLVDNIRFSRSNFRVRLCCVVSRIETGDRTMWQRLVFDPLSTGEDAGASPSERPSHK